MYFSFGGDTYFSAEDAKVTSESVAKYIARKAKSGEDRSIVEEDKMIA